jgi:hypothetical protein
MVKSDAFYRCFEDGLAQTGNSERVQRSRGKLPKYKVAVPGDSVSLWFKVNGKASAIPYQPGEFWPVIEAKTMRHDTRDDGLVSWYQYTDKAMEAAIQAQRKLVYDKTREQAHFEPDFWRQTRDVWLAVSRESLELELGPGFPHTRLYYLDENDATQWGVIFGTQLETWISRFAEKPQTLQQYMWRVQWNNEVRAQRETTKP